jgi:hypothetical protein
MKCFNINVVGAIALILFAILVPGFSTSVHAQTGPQKITIPAEPTKGVIDLTGKENAPSIIFQEGDSEEYFFRYIQSIAVDSKGNFVLLGERRIIKYNSKGKFLSYIGAIGQGPGEYNYPSGVFFDEHDHLYVLDSTIVVHFDDSGKFVKNYRTKTHLKGTFFIEGGKWAVAIGRSFTDGGAAKSVYVADLLKETYHPFFTAHDPEVKAVRNKKTGGGIMAGVIHPYSSKMFAARLDEKQFCFATSFDDDIHIADYNGTVTRIIDLGIKPVTCSKEEEEYFVRRYKRRGVKIIERLPHRPKIENLLTDRSGRIYVVLKKSVADLSPVHEMLVLDTAGRFLNRVKLPISPRLIKNGFAYCIARNGEDEIIVNKIKVTS